MRPSTINFSSGACPASLLLTARQVIVIHQNFDNYRRGRVGTACPYAVADLAYTWPAYVAADLGDFDYALSVSVRLGGVRALVGLLPPLAITLQTILLPTVSYSSLCWGMCLLRPSLPGYVKEATFWQRTTLKGI